MTFKLPACTGRPAWSSGPEGQGGGAEDDGQATEGEGEAAGQGGAERPKGPALPACRGGGGCQGPALWPGPGQATPEQN